MRSLPLLAGKSHLEPGIQLELTSRDKGTTYVHCGLDIIDLGSVSWQGRFGGGLGKPSNYSVTLGFDNIDEVKGRLADYNRAEVRLRIDVGSETFYPHVGRVSSIKRDGIDPLRMKLDIVDRFLDDDPLIPGTAITDSYSGIHPVEADTIKGTQGAIQKLGKVAGYPWYYGDESLRDFYMTAVDCDLSQLIGPRNVSSEHHDVSSLFFTVDPLNSVDIDDRYMLPLNAIWEQQSGSTNIASNGLGFEVMGNGAHDTRFWEFVSLFADIGNVVSSAGNLDLVNFGYVELRPTTWPTGNSICDLVLEKIIPQRIFRLTKITFTSDIANVSGFTINAADFKVESGSTTSITNLDNDTGNSLLEGDIDITGDLAVHGLQDGRRTFFQHQSAGTFGGIVSIVVSMHIQASLASEGYRRFSVLARRNTTSVTSRFAISDNPLAILDHVNSQDTGVDFVESQSSDSQVNVANSSYAFNCFFADRLPAQDIFAEFGRITGTALWLGDSGMMNFRTYVISESVTIDRTLSPKDFKVGTFQIDERPVGSSLRESELARSVAVHYDYDFQRDTYDQVIRAFPGNSPACNSIDAAGVTREISEKSQYIMTEAVASAYLHNLVRLHTQDQSFVSGTLPAKHFDLELNDVLKIQNPMIVGSESLYQINDISHDYKEGTVEFTAGEILN